MEKRTLIALALAFVVLGTYPLFLQKMYPDYYKRLEQERRNAPAAPAAKSSPAPAVPGPPAAAPTLDRASDAVLSTGKVDLAYHPADGAIRKVILSDFAHPDNREPLILYDHGHAGRGLGAMRFLHASDPAAQSVSLRVSGQGAAAQGASSDGRFRFTQTSEWDGYSAKIRVAVENTTDADQKLRYAYVLGESIPPRHSIDGQYVESNFYERLPDGKKRLSHIKETKSGKIVSSAFPVEWAAVKDRHFAVIVKPMDEGPWTGQVRGLGDHRSDTSLLSPEIVLAPRGRVEHELAAFIGPVDIGLLLPMGLDPIVNFGKLDAIGRLLVGGLEMVQKVVRNYGVAIVLLTALINLLLFPLTRASMLSMKRMQLVQPQMAKLRGQHKNQPEKLNKEMMELYKKHKVNPFGGCLPMLLQMPVFIALYVALSKATILINARFLWVHDLSAPDSVPLPFSLPLVGAELHILPLIMAAGMAVQQRLTQMPAGSQDPMMEQQQKMMSVMMPIIFCFIFYSMPSGLVLYWLTNTVIMTAYQFHLKRVAIV